MKKEDAAFPGSWNEGMSKREYFAAAAIAASVSELNKTSSYDQHVVDRIASTSVRIADALILELEKIK